MFTSKSVLALALAAAIPALTACAGSQSANVDDSALYQRAAKGDITQFAGARRLSGDMTDLYQKELLHAAQKHAKNVILLIGDGMGDSEITATLLMVPAVCSRASMLCLSPASTPTIP